MLRWIIALTVLCGVSATLGFGQFVPLASAPSGLFLAIFAVSATLLIGSFEAYETQGVRVERDER